MRVMLIHHHCSVLKRNGSPSKMAVNALVCHARADLTPDPTLILSGPALSSGRPFC